MSSAAPIVNLHHGECVVCHQVVKQGLFHKVATVAGEEFHRMHEECVEQLIREGKDGCPLCPERVTNMAQAEAVAGDEHGECLCGLPEVIDAAEKGESATVYEILNGVENPVPYQKKAVRAAAAYGHNDIVRTLLNGCTNFENSKDALSGMDALISGAWGGNIEIVRETLNRYPSINRDGAVCAAAEKGQNDVLRLLMTNATISSRARQKAIKEALQNGHMGTVLLLSRGYIAYSLVAGAAAAIAVRVAMDALTSYQHSEL